MKTTEDPRHYKTTLENAINLTAVEDLSKYADVKMNTRKPSTTGWWTAYIYVTISLMDMEKIQVYPKNYFNSFRMWLDIPGYQLQDFLNKRVASLNYDDSVTLKRGSKKEKIHIEFIKDGFHCKLALPRLCFPISSDEFQDLQVYQPLKASQFFLEAFKYLPHSLSLWILLLNYLCVYFYFKLQPTLFNNYELKLKEKLDALFFVSTLTFVVPIIVFFIAWILLRYTKDYRVRNGLKGEIFFYASIYLFLATSFIRMIIRSRNDALFDFLYHAL